MFKILNLFIIVLLFFLSNCQSVKNALTGKRTSKGEEFLVKKKDPLILPPDFGSLPVPGQELILEDEEEYSVIEDIIGVSQNDNQIIQSKSGSLEESIIQDIKKK